MEQIKFGCYWQGISEMPKRSWNVGRIAHLHRLQMLPAHCFKGILYHILLINNEFPVLSELCSVLSCMSTAECVFACVWVYIFMCIASGACVCFVALFPFVFCFKVPVL